LLRVIRPGASPGDEIDVAQDASVYVGQLDPGVMVEQTVPTGHGGYFYLTQGGVALNDEQLSTGDAAYVRGDGLLRIRADQPSEVVLVDTVL
jgi:redox-sensitive bicupin YhaK (pirin superfamily)